MSSRWGDIYNKLKSLGWDVYSPAQHEGECISPYVVIKIGTLGQINGFSSTRYLYDLMLYVPKNMYSELEGLVEKLKSDMKSLEPMIMPMHFQTASFYDDGIKAHMISVQYRNNRKL